MSLGNCPQCGKLYMKNAAGMCSECRIEYEKQVETVLEYMRDVPKATVVEISKATGIREKIIFDLIKRGALIGSEGTISYPCEKCGKPIEQGRLCNECITQINKEMGLLKPAEPEPETKGPKFSQKSSSKWHAH